jgi:hypothetical protein
VFNIKLKKKLTLKANRATEKPKAVAKKSEKNLKKPKNPAAEKSAKPEPDKVNLAEAEKDKSRHTPVDLKEAKDPFVGIKEYGSAVEIVDKIDREIAAAKSTLGKYLRKLDSKREIAEKSKRLHDAVAKLANKKEIKENSNKIEVNGLEIDLDATPLNEVTAMESVVKSYQQRLMALQKAQEALETLDNVGDTEGIRYMVLEREGVPERILLKLT